MVNFIVELLLKKFLFLLNLFQNLFLSTSLELYSETSFTSSPDSIIFRRREEHLYYDDTLFDDFFPLKVFVVLRRRHSSY